MPETESPLPVGSDPRQPNFNVPSVAPSKRFPKWLLMVAGGVGLAVLGWGMLFFLPSKENYTPSEFELSARMYDASGVSSDSTFLLTTTTELDEDAVSKNLIAEPTVALDVQKVSATTYEIKPKEKLRENTVLSLKIEEGPIAARTFSWAYQIKSPFQVISTLPLDRSTNVPLNTGIEIELNREKIKNADDAISVSPAVKGRMEVRRNRLVFIPSQPLAQKTIYTVTLKSGLGAEGTDDTLAESETFSFETGEREAQTYSNFYFDKTFWEFIPGTEPALTANIYNAQTTGITTTVRRFGSVDEFISAYRTTVSPELGWSRFGRLRAYAGSAPVVFQGDLNIQEQQSVKFLEIPQKLDQGYYLMQVTVDGRKIDTWIQMTSMASYIAVSPAKTLVSLRALTDGSPQNGIEVTMGSAKGRTDGNGVVVLNTPSEAVQESNLYQYSDLPGLFAVANAGSGAVAIPFESRYGGFYKLTPSDRWWDYISTDKTIYAPTDVVRFWGIVKQRVGDDIRGSELKIQLTDQYWYGSPDDMRVYGETRASVNDFNTVTGDISYAGLRPGLYQLSVRRGDEIIVSQTINVEAYIKPAYKLIIEPSASAVYVNETITYKVRAEFYDGTPVRNLAVKYSSYGPGAANGTLTLNGSGEGQFTARPGSQTYQYSYYPYYFGMTVSPVLAEEGEIASNTSVLVFGSSVKLNISQQHSSGTTTFKGTLRRVVLENVQRGQPYWVESSYLGDPVSGTTVTAQIVEIIHDRQQTGTGYDPIHKTTYPIYHYSSREVPAGSRVATTDGRGEFQIAIPVEKGRQFRVNFSALDAQGRADNQTRYAADYEILGSYYETGLHIKNADDSSQTKYDINEPFSLTVEGASGAALPNGNKTFLFIRLVGGSIHSYTAVDEARFSDTLREEYIPNIGILGVWFGGKRFHDSWPYNISFDTGARSLKVSITKDKNRYRPGEEIKLNIDVRDRNGRGQEAEVNVAALDEAAFSLNPEERDINNEVYRDVYASLQTRSSHFTALQSGAEGGGCFAAGTQILLPSGLINIEDIRIGDLVLSRADSHDPSLVSARVSHVSSHLVYGYLVLNGKLRVTANHPIYVNGRWAQAGAIQVGDSLADNEGNIVRVDSVEVVDGWVRVYNFEVAGQHTYFADGIFVHNAEKGGGGSRSDFRDTALYQSVRTDGGGRATVTFKAPDNITSWKITAQAVTKDLFVGKGIEAVPVSLPFFVDATLNRTYLTNDTVALRVRGIGAQSVTYSAESDTLPFKKVTTNGSDGADLDLQKLTAGSHTVTISGQAGSLRDSIKRTVRVLDSYMMRSATKYYDVTSSLENIAGSPEGFTDLVFTSQERGKLYGAVRSYSWTYGPRFEETVSRVMSDILLKRYFGEESDTTEELSSYLSTNGGIAMFPYSGPDLSMSAKFADLMQGETHDIPADALRQYFKNSLNDQKADIHRVVLALYGLASLRDPVLTTLQNIQNDSNLTFTDKIYIALALDAAGAKEESRKYWEKELKPQLERKDPYISVAGLTGDDGKVAVALLANLSAGLQVPEADGLAAYAMENRPLETLTNLEMLGYIKKTLKHLRGGEVKFSFTTNSKNETIVLKKDEAYRVVLNPTELASLDIKNVDGRVGVVSHYEVALSPDAIQRDSSISVTRKYRVNGKETTTFKDGDVVRIEITPSFNSKSLPGGYQITDFLPSGLRPVTKFNTIPVETLRECVVYPSVVHDQRISFYAWNPIGVRCPSLSYYARVVTKGTFRADPAIIQSLKNVQMLNVSAPASVTIQ